MGFKKLYIELIKSLVKKILEAEQTMPSVSLYKTCQEIFPKNLDKKQTQDFLTSVEDFNKFEKTQLKVSNFNAQETNMDYESFMEIIGDVEDALDQKSQKTSGQIIEEARDVIIEKCSDFFCDWV